MRILKNKNYKKIKSDYPVVIIEKFLNKKTCDLIINEIKKFNKFDDRVMVSRNRINKGSFNFEKFITNSKISRKLYDKLNKYSSYNQMKNLLEVKKSNWSYTNIIEKFSKTNYGAQKSTILNFLKDLYNSTPLKESILNLDVDFSIATNGYFREAHRDRDNRVVNFLIYFNDVSKKSGGSFNICGIKKKYKANKLPRFPKKKEIFITEKIFPKVGTLVIFLSSPDSYHEAGKFKSNFQKRFFLYGSYSLNKKIDWFKK